MNNQRKTHLIWDWNGTLLDDAWLCIATMNTILKERRLPTLTLDEYREKFDFPVVRYYQRIGIPGSNGGFEQASVEFIEHYEKQRLHCELFPGVLDVLDLLKRQDYSHSLLSAYKEKTLIELIDHFKLTALFDNVSGQGDIFARGKIDQGKQLIQQLGCPPSRVLLIGDTLHDYEVAEAIGVDCVLVAGGHHSVDRLLNSGVLVLDSIREIPALLTRKAVFL